MRGHDYMSEIAGELWVDNPDIPVTSAEQVKDYNQVDPTTNKPKTIEQLNTEFKTAIQALENATGNTTLVSRVNNLWNLLGTEEDVDNVINKFNEVVAFLNGIEETDRLNSLLDAIRTLINAKANKSDLYVEQGYGANADKVTIILGEGIGKSATVLKEHQDISGKANSADLATVATSGDYNDLTNKPTIPLLNDYATKAWVGEQGFLTAHQDISGKVDKVTGKGLSTNDYTTEEKTKLGALPTNNDLQIALSGKQDTISDLSTIRSGAAAGATAVQPADIAALDATESGTSTDGKVSVEVTETDGVVTGVEVTTNDIASASALSAEVARAQGVEANKANAADVYTKQEVNGLVSTPHQNYVTVADYASLPSSGQATDTIYRVSNYDGTQVDTTKYAEYAWNGTQYVLLSVKSAVGEVFDISDYNSDSIYNSLSEALGTNGDNVPVNNRKPGMSLKFRKRLNYDLYSVTVETDTNNAQLDGWSNATTIEHELVDGTDLVAEAIVANLDTTVTNDHSEKGDVLAAIQALNLNGTAKFAYTLIDTIEGDGDISLQRTYYYLYTVTKTANEATEYVQYRLMSTVWSIATSDWQGIDDEPTAGSENLVKSKGIYDAVYGDSITQSSTLKSNLIAYDYTTVIAKGTIYQGYINASLEDCLCINTYFEVYNGQKKLLVHCEDDITIRVAFYDSNKTFISDTGQYSQKKYITIPSNAVYYRIAASYNGRGYSSSNPVSISDYVVGDFYPVVLSLITDDVPTDSSNNLVKSGGVYEKISQQSQIFSQISSTKVDVSPARNLVNKDDFINGGTYLANGTLYRNASYCYNPKFVQVKENTTYHFSGAASPNGAEYKIQTDAQVVCFYNESFVLIGSVTMASTMNFTTIANCKYVRLAVYKAYFDLHPYIMLVEGTERGVYEEFNPIGEYLPNKSNVPMPNDDSVITSNGVSGYLLNNFIVGKGNTISVFKVYNLLPNRKYAFYYDIDKWDTSSVTSLTEYDKIFVTTVKDGIETRLYHKTLAQDLENGFVLETPQDFDYLIFGGRVNNGIRINVGIIDVTDIYKNISDLEISLAESKTESYEGKPLSISYFGLKKLKTFSPIIPIQSAACYGDIALLFNNPEAGSVVHIYDMKQKNILATLTLPKPGGFANPHCNTACLGAALHSENSIMPLVYISTARPDNSVLVYDITLEDEVYAIDLVQTINFSAIQGQGLTFAELSSTDCYIDNVGGYLYLVGYKTNSPLAPQSGYNKVVVCKLALPDVTSSVVTITAQDIIHVFEVDNIPVLQDGVFDGGRLIINTGFPASPHLFPSTLYVIDIQKEEIVTRIPISKIHTAEPEGLMIYKGQLLSIYSSGIYRIDL